MCSKFNLDINLNVVVHVASCQYAPTVLEIISRGLSERHHCWATTLFVAHAQMISQEYSTKGEGASEALDNAQSCNPTAVLESKEAECLPAVNRTARLKQQRNWKWRWRCFTRWVKCWTRILTGHFVQCDGTFTMHIIQHIKMYAESYESYRSSHIVTVLLTFHKIEHTS